MHLIQILLPLSDSTGRRISSEEFERVRKELTEKFGGLTAYTRSPAKGLWKDGPGTVQDEIVIHEVMADQLDTVWWAHYRDELCRRFLQDELVIRSQEIQRL
jgi:hypothetical protein